MSQQGRGFSLIELLVVVSLISLLVGLLLPALARVRSEARTTQKMSNQKQIISAVTIYALDHQNRYPESVATIGLADNWHWQEPTMLTGFHNFGPQRHRAMSEYLRPYIPTAGVMYCPNAPKRYQYLQAAWEAGDAWDNPDPMTLPLDPLVGTYCFYWNYVGYLPGRGVPFQGPRRMSGGRRQSKLLVSDYFGYGHWRNKDIYDTCFAYGSCEKIKGANVTPGTSVSSAYWSVLNEDGKISPAGLGISSLHAGYTDGRVEAFLPSHTITMQVAIQADGSVPYPIGAGPGDFFLPANSLY